MLLAQILSYPTHILGSPCCFMDVGKWNLVPSECIVVQYDWIGNEVGVGVGVLDVV